MMKKNLFNTTKKRILAFIMLLTVGFIFSNSLQTGEESTKISEIAAKIVSGFVLFFFGKDPLDSLVNYFYTDFLQHIRIIAHFIEFFILGFITVLFVLTQDFLKSKYVKSAVSFGLLIAIMDETIQLFITGRAFQLIDIFIDMMGFLSAVFLVYIFKSIKKRAENFSS